MNKILCVFCLTFFFTGLAQADSQALAKLLQQLKTEQQQHRSLDAQREAEFSGSLDDWQRRLAALQERHAEARARSQTLSDQFDANEQHLAVRLADLDVATANLGELFGVVRQISREFAGTLESSLISAQYPQRAAFVASLAERKGLPSSNGCGFSCCRR